MYFKDERRLEELETSLRATVMWVASVTHSRQQPASGRGREGQRIVITFSGMIVDVVCYRW